MNTNASKPHVLILGGGTVGMNVASELTKKLGSNAAVTVVDSRPYLTYQPFLPEVGAGAIDPRNVLAPLRKVLKGAKVVTGTVDRIDHKDRSVQVKTDDDVAVSINYDYLVIGLGAVPRTLPIPGLAENAIGFKQVEEAIAVRDRILANLAEAASTKDAETRKRLLTFTFVGGGFAGGEAVAEAQDMVRAALRYYPDLHPSDVRFVVVEAMGRILPEVGDDLGKFALKDMRERGIEVKLETFLNSCEDGIVKTSDGDEFASDLIVWTAGIKPNPVLANSDLPLNQTGRLDCMADLRVKGENGPLENVFAAGDCTTVPDLASGEGKVCPPNAQHAQRQAVRLADNIVRDIDGRPLVDYFHKNLGTVATLGMYKGVGQLFIGGKTIELKGLPAWAAARAYHVYAMPTFARKAAVIAGWATNAIGNRDILGIPESTDPRRAFELAAASTPKKK
ncbi:NAD(P)/FAD-dependent oxidoreductase [Helcobacillus massiliensis]|uniref:NADH dehydrogenase n=1 Tax=Helcobacillus massiliensis TaxID=521392 RepID=A0A839QS60_9MICO|nr:MULTISPECIES: NAD(P)/FAD-dependent oxidoreductase [Helcobacillus]MBB3022605.1 NADH dehydrogenase [Helcobacillus massiliensis]MCG7427626.1 NAD(P)/FAD-dependent oxidoreductase [Helcobacillus sp. ACRRO]MCT1558721.1 NAD(P)/FAD-dependent oxidoreductase [Helcobacillus massiliensis]MCT2037440.1 NAD(P)/FAD-dependent oxidoreductase [Helcobacillus massiliensis]MCT2332960.1 NAD(P)/FAD-dependent oxidoreductase [Helcobacillus massiliensis]